MGEKKRCPWCGNDPLYQSYHDQEWGVPVYDDKKLFEFLILEGAQAGLSWLTVLKKREGYRKAFDQFDVRSVARFQKKDVERLLNNNQIIRNRLKIQSAVTNAQAFLKVQEEFGSFSNYQWQFVENSPLKGKRKSMKEVPARTEISDVMSADLKKRGFKFVGSTIIYAHMQAVGMVNDHLLSCFRYKEVGEPARRSRVTNKK